MQTAFAVVTAVTAQEGARFPLVYPSPPRSPERSHRRKRIPVAAAQHRVARRQAKHWNWSTAPTANLNPGDFILEQDKMISASKPGNRCARGGPGAARIGCSSDSQLGRKTSQGKRHYHSRTR